MFKRISFRFHSGSWLAGGDILHLLPSISLLYLSGFHHEEMKLHFPGFFFWNLELAWLKFELDIHFDDKA